MQHLTFANTDTRPFEILCLGAHADDIEIGAGGAILTLLGRYPNACVHWVVFAADETRAREARSSAAVFLATAGRANVAIHSFRDGFFPDEFSLLKKTFEALKRTVNPDLILTHVRNDHHQDHRTIAELTWNTFRDHLILGYEVIKYDPDMGNPNVFVTLAPDIADLKVKVLMENFLTQRGRRWFVPETFLGIMRVRGVHSAAPSGLAEGFYGPKLCF